MVQTTTPKNAQQALAEANRLQRAQQILKEGYTFHKDVDSEVVAVCKPGETKATYWINMLTPGCDCPDRMKTQKPCKHEYAWELLEAEEADDAANMEAQCRMYDAEEGRHLDRIPTPTLTKDVLRAMEQDLAKVNADIDAQGERRTGYLHCQHQHDRAGRLENALTVVNAYARPADVPAHLFCTTCGIANINGKPSCFGSDCPNRITR